MPEPPGGKVTFLFTDVEGSTKLWERDAQGMHRTLAAHDVLLRATIEAHRGCIFKTMGDAFCAAFASARDAVQAAIAGQQALQREVPQLRVRMALHTGEAELRDGDYFGPSLNLVARLLTAGHGGQVLLSRGTAELVRSGLPGEAQLRSLGMHRLRDIATPETIFQLVSPGLPADFPPLNTLDTAFRRGMRRAAAISGVVMVLLAALALFANDERQIAQEGQKTLRRLLYVATMNVAQQACEAENFGRAMDLLEGQPPGPGQEDLRGFEWRYLWRLCQENSQRTLRDHRGQLFSVAFSLDGKTLATGGVDAIKLWDLPSGRCRATLPPVPDTPWAGRPLALSPDGKLLAASSAGGSVKLWEIATPREVTTLRASRPHGGGVAVAFSPNGKTLAVARMNDANTVTLWEIASRRKVATLKGHRAAVTSVAFSPDGEILATGSDDRADNSVKLWDVAAGRAIATLKGQQPDVNGLSFSPDGKRLLTAGDDPAVRLWDLASRRVVATLQRPAGAIWSMALSSDGKTLATGSNDNLVTLWEMSTRRKQATLHGHSDGVWDVAFSPDSKTLATASLDHTAKLWDASAMVERSILRGHAGGINSVAFSPDGRILATGSDDRTVKLWDLSGLPTGGGSREFATLTGHQHPIGYVAFSADGRTVAAGTGWSWMKFFGLNREGPVTLWDSVTKTEAATLGGLKGTSGPVAFSPDGKLLAAARGDGTVTVWEVATRRAIVTLKRPTDPALSVVFSPDGRTLATGNRELQLWDGATGQELDSLFEHGGWVYAAAFSPDGRTLAISGPDKTVRLWDLARRREVAILKGHSNQVTSLVFSPDGQTLASGSSDKSVKLWNVVTRREAVTLHGHTDAVYSVAFSPDGNILASGSQDHTVRLWRAASFAETDGPAGAQGGR